MSAPATLAPLYAVGLAPLRPAAISLTEALERSRADRENRRFVQHALDLDGDGTGEPDDERLFGPQPTSSVDLPDPRPVAARLGLALAEIMAGLRSPAQVVRWTTPEVHAVLARRASTVARRAATSSGRPTPRPRIRVLRVHVCRPADGVAEASVVLEDGPRVRAMALRLTGMDGRWRVEVLQVA